MHAANRSINLIARSVAPSSTAPASDVTAPPSNAATRARPSTGLSQKHFRRFSAPIHLQSWEIDVMAIPASAKAMTFIVTRDRGKAKSFYGDPLGLALMQEDDFAAVFDLNGTKLRISEVADHAPQSHTVLGWEVADISETAKALRGKGIAFNRYDGLAQDELGIWTAPGGAAKVAWFSDPDGNVLSLTQF